MWLYTKIGFFSITEDPNNPDQLQVRARRREDLEELIAATGINTDKHAIVANAGTDYQYRLYLPRHIVAEIVGDLVTWIDYTNFKRTIQGQRRHDIYSRVWGITQGLADIHDRLTPGGSIRMW